MSKLTPEEMKRLEDFAKMPDETYQNMSELFNSMKYEDLQTLQIFMQELKELTPQQKQEFFKHLVDNFFRNRHG